MINFSTIFDSLLGLTILILMTDGVIIFWTPSKFVMIFSNWQILFNFFSCPDLSLISFLFVSWTSCMRKLLGLHWLLEGAFIIIFFGFTSYLLSTISLWCFLDLVFFVSALLFFFLALFWFYAASVLELWVGTGCMWSLISVMIGRWKTLSSIYARKVVSPSIWNLWLAMTRVYPDNLWPLGRPEGSQLEAFPLISMKRSSPGPRVSL